MSKPTAVEHIRFALQELHRAGYAHGDVKISNCFVDRSIDPPIVFLDDLEYIRGVDDMPRTDWRFTGENQPTTARRLDELQFDLFEISVYEL